MKKKLLVAADMDRSFIEAVTKDPRFDVTLSPVKTEEQLLEAAVHCEVLVTRAYNQVTRRVIEGASGLSLIAQGTSGTDNIDQSAARERQISVISLPGENANAVAELVIGFMISMTRTMTSYRSEMIRGVWQRDDCASRHELAHYTLGIAGLGEVGRRVARLAAAFGMRVLAHDPYIEDTAFAQRFATKAKSLEELIQQADILTPHVPLNEETRGFIGANEIAALRPGSYLINASRGEIIDQTAALEALSSGHLAGLALDVYDPEPPRGPLPDLANLVMTPHTAGCTWEAKASIGAKLYRRICDHYWPAT